MTELSEISGIVLNVSEMVNREFTCFYDVSNYTSKSDNLKWL